ncbi:MAG TPA: hypothetical protein VD971_03485 [Phycisphaerales bacterium]|nr:hypothetical protein [Phycisphaerales bacterium]
MDERQQQIRERAGLDESRLNQDFIDFMRRWSTPLLVVLALVVGGWYAKTHFERQGKAKEDLAFDELQAARSGGRVSPETLLSVAEAHEGVGVVSIIARLDAADAYLDAVRRGVKPGATVNNDGTLANADDALTPADREKTLALAAEQYQRVLDQTATSDANGIYAMGALYGLAAVAESKGDAAGAEGYYERVSALAERLGYKGHVNLAKERLANLDAVLAVAPPPARAEIPAPLDTAPKTEMPGAAVDLGSGVVQPVPAPPADAPAQPPAEQPMPAPAEQPAPPAEQPR